MESFTYRDNKLFCEDVPVDAIGDEVGSPVYIYSKQTLLDRYTALAAAFSGIDTTICFSVKSCSSLGILGVLKETGSSFDIVSGGELHRVLKAGGDPSKVVYAGVGKTDAEIRFALEQGILMFNVESEAELENINSIAGEMNISAPVALRLNPDVDPKTHRHTTTGKKENKFGLDLERAGSIVDDMSKYPSATLKGLHVHIGSPVNSTQPYADALDKVLAFIDQHADGCQPVEYINCGGGFGLLYDQESVPEFDTYAAAIVPRVEKSGRKLIIEPGRSIAGNAGILVSSVQYVKSNGEKTFVIVDAAMNDLIRPTLYEAYHRIWPTESDCPPPQHGVSGGSTLEGSTSVLVRSDIVGPVCESGDTFAKDRTMPRLTSGDRLAFFSAGAYGFTMASNYNSRPRPAEVLVEGDQWRVIRKRETWEDLTAHEIL